MLNRKDRREIEARNRKILKKVKSGDWVEVQQAGNLGQPVYVCMHESRFDATGYAMATIYNTMFGEDAVEMGMISSDTHYFVKRLNNEEALSLPAGVLSIGARNQKNAIEYGEAC